MKNLYQNILAKGLPAVLLFITANAGATGTPALGNSNDPVFHSVFSKLSLVNPTDTTLVDGSMAIYDPSYNNGVDYDDAVKLTNGAENVGLLRNGVLLAIERRHCVCPDDTLFINVTGYRMHQYRWDFALTNMDSTGRTAYLIDNYLGTTTMLNGNGNNPILFDVNATPGTYAADRFMIIFKETATLPVRFSSISAVRNAEKTVTVKWSTENEINMQDYNIQHSNDGLSFSDIGEQLASATNGAGSSYSFNDARATSAYNYYRIKGNSLDGEQQFTAIVKVGPSGDIKPTISVYPNPVTGGNINLRFENQPKGNDRVYISNNRGQIIHAETVQATNDNFVRMISLGSNAAPGSYQVTVVNEAGARVSVSFVVN